MGYKRRVATTPDAPASSAPLVTPLHRIALGRAGLDRDGVVTGVASIGAIAVLRALRAPGFVQVLTAVAGLGATLFFRDPHRSPADDDPNLTPVSVDDVLAASDGRVLAVEEVVDPRIGPQRWLRIATFLSVLDVHVNRVPIAGEVVAVQEHLGGFAMAQKEAAEHNVARYLTLATAHGPVVVAQRTGLIARRIVTRVHPGDRLATGQRYGLIRFGSRTDVHLPTGTATPLVRPGDRIRGGRTVIARFDPVDPVG